MTLNRVNPGEGGLGGRGCGGGEKKKKKKRTVLPPS